MAQGLGRDEEFFKWANDYFINPPHPVEYSPDDAGYFNTLIFKDKAFEAFQMNLTPKQKHEYKKTKFKKHLEAWCEYWSYELNPDHVCTDFANQRIMKTIEGKTKELIYISTASIKNGYTPSAPPAPLDDDNKPPF
jgi:hypothetical protein